MCLFLPNLSRFDEATPPAVSMTESRTQRDCSQMAVECEGASQAILVTLLAGDTVEIPSQCSNRESDDRRSGATSLENDCSSRLPWEHLGQHSYTRERLYGMLTLKAREAAFWVG